MFEIYEVEAWLIWLPWVLLGVTGIILWRSMVAGKRWMKRHDLAMAQVEQAQEKREETIDLLYTAKAAAHECFAAHQEAVRKLEAEKAEVVKWKGLAEIWQGKAEKLHQKRGKDGRFSPKRKR